MTADSQPPATGGKQRAGGRKLAVDSWKVTITPVFALEISKVWLAIRPPAPIKTIRA